MKLIYPDYYKEFSCIKDKCKHNCCIGWEIDIDDNTAEFYKSVNGTIGEKLRNNISFDEQPHFILGKNERCPFLNNNNLCDIIIELGKEHICEICSEHPRFKNELPNRVEIGLGLCCESAAKLILGKKSPTVLQPCEVSFDEIIILRDKIINILQNRAFTIQERIENMLTFCNIKMPDKTIGEWVDILLSLERLDNKWTDVLLVLKNEFENMQISVFDEYMKDRQYEYEQLLVYFIYRYFANSPTVKDTKEKILFAVFSYMMIYSLGAAVYTQKGEFTFEAQVELARLFSSEIEYSDENLYILYDELTENF